MYDIGEVVRGEGLGKSGEEMRRCRSDRNVEVNHVRQRRPEDPR